MTDSILPSLTLSGPCKPTSAARILTVAEIGWHAGWWGTFDPPIDGEPLKGRGWALGEDRDCPLSAACAAIKHELMRVTPPEHERKKRPSEAKRKKNKENANAVERTQRQALSGADEVPVAAPVH